MQILYILTSIFILANVAAFIIMLLDKNKSKNPQHRRIPEGVIFFLATCFGSIGVLLGIHYLRHKSQKWYFLIGIPLILLQNIATLYLFYMLLSGGDTTATQVGF